MIRKIELGIGLAGLAIGLAAWLFPMSVSHVSGEDVTIQPSQKEPFYKSLMPTPTLLISGTGARVAIMVGPNDAEFEGGEVSETGAESTIYLKKGQKINLNLTGTGASVFVQAGLMPYINIKNTATGGSIREL
ncbi:MAG: hypothetical protein EP334_01490 [Gammaproteobacteria bacterium]|nr:MAG: hypothetical protein EP334_01490 [Gammaproteobacteria bacterium]